MNPDIRDTHDTGKIHMETHTDRPRLPIREAPASFGRAGLSAGEGDRIKHHIASPREARRRDARDSGKGTADALAIGLGWFSIGLGLAELLGGRRAVGEPLGMEDNAALLRAYGLREIVTGVGILIADGPTARAPWMWGRVAGDLLDLATLSTQMGEDNPDRQRVMAAAGAVAGVTVLDIACAVCLSRDHSE